LIYRKAQETNKIIPQVPSHPLPPQEVLIDSEPIEIISSPEYSPQFISARTCSESLCIGDEICYFDKVSCQNTTSAVSFIQ
jgi:hypothetical protein